MCCGEWVRETRHIVMDERPMCTNGIIKIDVWLYHQHTEPSQASPKSFIIFFFSSSLLAFRKTLGVIMCWVFSSSIGDISCANSSGFDSRKAETSISLSPRKNVLLGVHTATATTLSFAEKMFFFSGSQTNNKILLCRVLKITSRRRRSLFFFRLSDR